MRSEGLWAEQADSLNKSEIQNELFVKEGFGEEKARELGKKYLRLHPTEMNSSDDQEAEDLWWPSFSSSSVSNELMTTKHENSFYLNSSDDIRTLVRVAEVRGKSVLTVAGSGDFAQCFLHAGARSVDMVDISYPGVLYNELKMVALRILDWSTFQSVFDLNQNRIFNAIVSDFIPEKIYGIIRPHLSQVCKTFFDELLQFDRETKKSNFHIDRGFARSRYLLTNSHGSPFRQFIGDQIITEDGYKKLQSKAINTPIHIHRLDILDFCQPERVCQVVYLSNIGYQPGITADLARKFLEAGAERVYFSVDVCRLNCMVDENGQIKFFHLFDQEGQDKTYKLPLPPIEARYGLEFFAGLDSQRLASGDMLVKFPNLIARIHGWTNEVEFGMTVEVRRGDQ